ncbi:sensor histidine kinase [Microtetraspora sp. NBRC 16547]|uniref:sensor histidine kinase n=1 Tax=Microtetraspora sp. NBRC 16547 TaxID=3030993 RepID=UPI0024A5543B|nr:sensor histidine kinase [Microtetraspora sp. NBRC 16547]GLX01858.1 two-component sensor histidine kinase [Microtetraspora sp. NBRC 16547]
MATQRSSDGDTWLNPLREGERGPDAKGMVAWVLLTGGPVWDITHGRSHPLWLAWTAAILTAALYLVTIRFAFGDRRRAQRLWLPLLAVVVFAGTATFGDNWLYLLVLLAIALGVTVRSREMPLLLFALCGAAAAIAWWRGGDLTGILSLGWGIFCAGLIPAMIIRLWEAIRDLQRTREELARAAVTEERLRFSRDLHDLLGHTLSVIVVKAEAVRRLAPRDVEAAAGQAADIERIGRDALTEVRAAVTGYRGRGLAAELDSARTALADAGIALTIRTPSVDLPPETDALLGWAVREGVTNVIRHSGATRCEIELEQGTGGGMALRVSDNGGSHPGAHSHAPDPQHGPQHGPQHAAEHGLGRGARQGNGLVGLRERVRAAGGRLSIDTPPSGGFRLQVTLDT